MNSADYIPWDKMTEVVSILSRGSVTDRRDAFLINLGCHVALRISDILSLKWEDLVFASGVVKEHIVVKEKKRGKVRQIALAPSIRKHIASYYDEVKRPISDPVFDITARGVNYRLQQIKWGYGIKGVVSTHSFRKTWARRVYDKHQNSPLAMEMISEAIGHSNVGVTRRYLGFKKDEIRDLYLTV